jgi:hypothetical protein
VSVTRRNGWWAGLPIVIGGLVGCSDLPPLTTEPGLIPVVAETFEVRIPFESFGADLRVDEGFGHPSQGDVAWIGYDAASGDQSVALTEYDGFLRVISYLPPNGSAEVADSLWVPVGGSLLLFLDSARVAGDEPFRLIAERMTEPFDFDRASWGFAVDTLGGAVPWSTPGGGVVEAMGAVDWRPSIADTIRIPFDSVQAARFVRAANGILGIRIRTTTDGARLRLRGADVEVNVRPSQHPEITVPIRPFSDRQTYIQSASATRGGGTSILVGGSPSWRSSFSFRLPTAVPAPASLCEGVPPCTVPLTAGTVVYAGLELRSTEQRIPLLLPSDTTLIEVRPVLAPELLPKSPLGNPIQIFGRRIPPSVFQPEGAGAAFEIPVTRFVRELLVGTDARGNPVPFAVSILGAPEPSGLGVLTFAGPGSPDAPVLRLILTRSPGVTIR